MEWVASESSLFLKFDLFLWGNIFNFPLLCLRRSVIFNHNIYYLGGGGGTEHTLSPLTQSLGGTRPPRPPRELRP